MRILVVDDDDLSREAVADFLEEDLGCDTVRCRRGDEALAAWRDDPCPVVVTDLRMPGLDGISLLREIRSLPGGARVHGIIMTGYGDMETAVEALRVGAVDYLLKPLNIEELAVLVARLTGAGVAPAAAAETQHLPGIGEVGIFSDSMREAMAMAAKLHSFRTVPVLIEGETGTGKEIVARRVHHGPGDGASGPFIAVNCAAISATLFESELFGYEKGAFTGAAARGKPGKLELARGGTLFLDEIGELPLDLQPKLLRVLQQREFYRVGGVTPSTLDARVVCATNRDLRAEVEAGRFRQDLFFRLNVGRIAVRPLRESPSSIVPLARLLLRKLATRYGLAFTDLSREAVAALRGHPWPGNVRQLENVIERATLLHNESVLDLDHLDLSDTPALAGDDQRPADGDLCPLRLGRLVLPAERLDLEELEKEIVRKALAMFDGNKTRTAEYLCISRGALYNRLAKL